MKAQSRFETQHSPEFLCIILYCIGLYYIDNAADLWSRSQTLNFAHL